MTEKGNPSSSHGDRELAQLAKNQFHSNKYDESLQTLNKIKSDGKSTDAKVDHNKVVAQYYQGNCTEPKKLLEDLAKIRKRLEDKLQEQEEEEIQDINIILYNMAVINYQLRQFATCLSILETLFHNIEPMDENLAIRICFLLGELYLNLKYKDKVSLVIGYLEKTFSQFTSDKKDSESVTTSFTQDSLTSNFRMTIQILPHPPSKSPRTTFDITYTCSKPNYFYYKRI
jgi:CCR4-NOT transcription complex subunit 10